jgi:hypothetical protein
MQNLLHGRITAYAPFRNPVIAKRHPVLFHNHSDWQVA